MAVTYEVLRHILRSGSNLKLDRVVPHDILRELVILATETGSHITIPTSLPYELVRELATIGKGNITFIDD